MIKYDSFCVLCDEIDDLTEFFTHEFVCKQCRARLEALDSVKIHVADQASKRKSLRPFRGSKPMRISSFRTQPRSTERNVRNPILVPWGSLPTHVKLETKVKTDENARSDSVNKVTPLSPPSAEILRGGAGGGHTNVPTISIASDESTLEEEQNPHAPPISRKLFGRTDNDDAKTRAAQTGGRKTKSTEPSPPFNTSRKRKLRQTSVISYDEPLEPKKRHQAVLQCQGTQSTGTAGETCELAAGIGYIAIAAAGDCVQEDPAVADGVRTDGKVDRGSISFDRADPGDDADPEISSLYQEARERREPTFCTSTAFLEAIKPALEISDDVMEHLRNAEIRLREKIKHLTKLLRFIKVEDS